MTLLEKYDWCMICQLWYINVALLKNVSISEKLQLTEGFFGPSEKEIASEKLRNTEFASNKRELRIISASSKNWGRAVIAKYKMSRR